MTTRTVLKSAAIAVVAIPLVLVVAAIVAHGPAAAWRLLTIGDSSIHDHAAFPARVLSASTGAPPLELRLRPDLPERAARHVGAADFETWLADTDTVALVVVDGDAVAYEWHADGRSDAAVSQVFSVSKSITSALIGAAIADGLIESVDQPVTTFVPELAGSGFADVAIRDLLQMRSGMDYAESDNPFGRHVTFNYTDRLETEILALSAAHDPDAGFRYRSGDNALLGLILSRALSPRSIADYTQTRLWEPLGMQSAGLWTLDRENGLERTWCCLAGSARDLARIGMLYRDGGAWQGEQILPGDWVRDSLAPAYTPERWGTSGAFAAMSNYGYQWWLGDTARGDFAAIGKDGQFLFVDPASGLVIVRLGEALGERGVGDWIALFRAMATARYPAAAG